MKRLPLLGFVIFLSLGVVFAQEKGMEKKVKKGSKEMAISGEVVDLACYLQQGARGEGHKNCAIACAKAGGSLAILTADGKLYVSLLPDDHKAGPNAILMDHIANMVIAKGEVRSSGGVNGIMIKSVEKMKTEKAGMGKKY